MNKTNGFDDDEKLHQIQVMNYFNAERVPGDGGQLQSNFMVAYFSAYEKASRYDGYTIEILLETG